MSIENLLNRLTKVKGGRGRWTACCPSHEDRSPSLAIKLKMLFTQQTYLGLLSSSPYWYL